MKRIFLSLVAVLIFLGTTSNAHFKLNQNVRIFHIVHSDEGLDIYFRTPMSYLVAALVGPVASNGLPSPAPFTTNQLVDGTPMHYVDPDALTDDPIGLAMIAANSIKFQTQGMQLFPLPINLRAYPIGSEPKFATKTEAVTALARTVAYPTDTEAAYVGDTVVDVHLRVSSDFPIDEYTIASMSNPKLFEQEKTANLILDYAGAKTRTYRATGLLEAPVAIKSSAMAAGYTFLLEGMRHILGGFDHVLFVLCMIIGSVNLGALLWRVTGFTAGHTVTLIMGFFGFVPSGLWFIPTVELLIAVSIIYAAAVAIFGNENSRNNKRVVTVTASIGLLHGFGFSFMLQNILQVSASNVWQSLLAFNLGVEVGQLLIVALIWPIVVGLTKAPKPTWVVAKTGVALCASFVAAFWVVERVGLLLSI